MKVEIVVLRGNWEVAVIKGEKILKVSEITKEQAERVVQTEAFLEELTGLRFHINQIPKGH